MNLLEYEGKNLFREYGIETPAGYLVRDGERMEALPFPKVLKAQVARGDRKNHGGIVVVRSVEEYTSATKKMLNSSIGGYIPQEVLVEDYIAAAKELYVSFSYNSETAVFALSAKGGSGIDRADVYPVDMCEGCTDGFIANALIRSGITAHEKLVRVIHLLWKLFEKERLVLAEINPLFEMHDGRYIAGDAKVQRDQNSEKREKVSIPLGGNIAVIASGGGASMLALDLLVSAGGKPANYIEYSGNPPASVVERLTVEVLSQKGLAGCWVVGGIANFTDIYETMRGFMDGLLRVEPKWQHPIVIRREGPRRAEAFDMLRSEAALHTFDITLFDATTPIAESARFLMQRLESRSS